LGVVAITGLSLTLAGCSGDEGGDEEQSSALEFKGKGQAPQGAVEDYPGPYSFEVGGIIPPYRFIGYSNKLDANLPGWQEINMREFYNPDGAGVFSEGSAWAGQPKPKVLVFCMSAYWCPPCREEHRSVIPAELPALRPNVQVVSVMMEGTQPGDPPLFNNLESWTRTYQINISSELQNVGYPQVIDPENKISLHFEPAFPGNMIIRTSDMRMVHRVTGLMQNDFWAKVENVVAGGEIQ
jgi:hypothetical protein